VKKNNQTKNSKAYSNMSKQEAKSLRESLAQKIEYQKQWGQPPKPKVIYHGSPQEIHDFVLQPHYLAGDDPVIFGTPNRTLSICYLARWSDSDFYQYTEGNDGIIYLDEKYPNAFEKVYKGKTGYLYELDPSTFEWDYQLSRSEFISRREPIVLNFEFINVYDELQKEARLGNLKINRFKSQGKVIDNPKKKGLSAVIIKGNPYYTKYGRDADKYKKYYKDIASLLREAGYTDISYDDGEPGTEPRKADLWLGHSRGADRLRFAPKGTKTLKIDDYEEGGENYSDLLLDKMHRLGYNTIGEFPVEQRPEPGAWHYTITQRLIDAIDSTVRKTRTNPMIEKKPEAKKAFKSKTIYGNVVSLKVAESYLGQIKHGYNELIRQNSFAYNESCSRRRVIGGFGNNLQDVVQDGNQLRVKISKNNISFDMLTVDLSRTKLNIDAYPYDRDGKKKIYYATMNANNPKVKTWVSTTKVTQDLYNSIMPNIYNQPSVSTDYAVVKSLNEAAEFCNRLSKLHKLEPYYEIIHDEYNGYDLSKLIIRDHTLNGYRLLNVDEWYWLVIQSLQPDASDPSSSLPESFSRFMNVSKQTPKVARKLPHCNGLYDVLPVGGKGEMIVTGSNKASIMMKKVSLWSDWYTFWEHEILSDYKSPNIVSSGVNDRVFVNFRIARNYSPLITEIGKHNKNISDEMYARDFFKGSNTVNHSNQGQQIGTEHEDRFSSFEIEYDSDEDEYDINFDD
jgi:hypothetical protein